MEPLPLCFDAHNGNRDLGINRFVSLSPDVFDGLVNLQNL